MTELSVRDIAYCKNVGAKRADIFRRELHVETALDLLRHYPYRYTDRSRMYMIRDIRDEETAVQIRGRLLEWHTIGVGKGQRLSAQFSDGEHVVELVWFRGINYLKLDKNREYLLFGKPSRFNHEWNFVHPELTPIEKVTKQMTEGFEPEYPTTERMKQSGLNSKGVRTIIAGLIPDLKKGVQDTLGGDVRERYHLMNLTDALLNVHFPANSRLMQAARERLKFEELFYIQLNLLRQQKRRDQNPGYPMPKVGRLFNTFYREYLPFTLTEAQKRVIREIHADMQSGRQMNRLLQGDVGSGKTLVAPMCALLAADNGYQTCIMAPTEILAQQHYETLRHLLRGNNSEEEEGTLWDNGKQSLMRIALLTGSTTKRQREELHRRLRAGEIDLLIGTHALLEDEVQFANLGLCIVDEQHRFGVAQRAKLWNKNVRAPHVLVMTATPIPRTLAMTLYGDLRVSIIDELPPGRKPVHTLHYSILRRQSINRFIREQVDLGRQVYVVYPLIKENEKLDLRDLENGYNELVDTFPDYRISMVHGQMRAADKEVQMQRFQRGETQILVATTVIEVGVNVPNASVMIIENAERFGLSQLHQLRGRVGRGAEQSYCILLTKTEISAETRKRMEIMVATNDGFKIAETDLQLRGPGDLDGTLQSGQAFELHIANLSTDGQILERARQAAEEVLETDPLLESEWNRLYKRQLDVLRASGKGPVNWGEIS